jgi:hypothetical protein
VTIKLLQENIMKTFNEKANYPFRYGDKNADKGMLSDYAVELMKTKRFQNHLTAIFFTLLTLGSYLRPSAVIPTEYGEAANEALNQAAQNGGVPAVPPIGPIQGQLPVAQKNQPYLLHAMPIEQQRLIAAQQAGQIGGMAGIPEGPVIGQRGPTNTPSFYIPGKPRSVGPRAINTVAFSTALGIICLNAGWGEPVAIMMCSYGLVGIAYKLGKEVVIFMARNINP